jgi:membrane protease YdiL (CAAX protease family)
MRIYIEALILFIILFFASSVTLLVQGTAGHETFSTRSELIRLFLNIIPALALIWYILLGQKGLKEWGLKPGKRDLISALITLPSLLLISFTIAFVSSSVGSSSSVTQNITHSPVSVFQWVVLCTSCLFAAYLEESFFRFYLLNRRGELNLSASWTLVLSVALFSLCHIYEGPWGFLNSVLSGIVLCFVFLRYKALHGLAISHGLYNISVYVINAVLL